MPTITWHRSQHSGESYASLRDYVLFARAPGFPIPDGGYTSRWTWEVRRHRARTSVRIDQGEATSRSEAMDKAANAIQIHEAQMRRLRRENREHR